MWAVTDEQPTCISFDISLDHETTDTWRVTPRLPWEAMREELLTRPPSPPSPPIFIYQEITGAQRVKTTGGHIAGSRLL
jgi:hypothetical protein